MATTKTQIVFVKICKVCGNEFVTNKREQKYCSRKCVTQSLRGSRSDKANAIRKIEMVDPWASGAIKPVCYDSDYYYTPDAMHGF